MFQTKNLINSKKKGLALVVLLSSIFILTFYGKVIFSPNSYLFNPSGDGMKNYYTYAYYIQNNTDNIEFEGMNYPYGESFMYTDCHPAQAFGLKVLNQYFPKVSSYSIGIINLTMILSIVLTSMVLYLLFNRLKIHQLLSVFGAIAITVLSPQIFRLTGGHYALSYSFFIPLTIYFLLWFETIVTRKNLLFFSLIVLLAFFTHAYIGMILFVLVFTYLLVNVYFTIVKGNSQTSLMKYLKIAMASFIPFVLFYLFIKLTDSHFGRTTNPWGIFENHADIGTVFLPVSGPLNTIKETLFDHLDQKWEGWAYVGIMAIIGFIVYFLSFIIKKPLLQKINNSQFIKTLFFSSVLILLFATLLPFRKVMYEIVDAINVIKQFRAIGRFAWVFFFVINIVSIYIINEVFIYFKSIGKGLIGYTLIVIIPLFIFIEGIDYHSSVAKEITISKNLFDLDQTSSSFQEDCLNIDADNYQAIIGLPFFYIGSENFGKTATQEIYKLSFLFSYHLNLPMVNSYLTRTAIDESKKIMQLLSKDFYKKPILSDLKNSKPFLVVCHHNQLSFADEVFLEKAKLLLKREDYSLYEISPSKININSADKLYDDFSSNMSTLYKKEGFLVSDTSLYFRYNDFNDTSIYVSLNGRGTYIGLQKGYNSILKIRGEELDENKNYIARFWMLNNGEKNGQDYLNGMIFFNKKNEEKGEWIFPLTDARNSHNIKGDWTLVEVELSSIDKSFNYELLIKGPDRSKQYYYIDDLLFYDSELDIYKNENGAILFHNNHKINIPNNY